MSSIISYQGNKVKTTIRHPFPSSRMAKIKKRMITNVGKDVEILSYIAVRNVKWYNLENCLAVPQKV